MTLAKIFAFVVGASLLFGFGPMAAATPLAAPPETFGTSASSGVVTQALLGIERRHERRVERRTHRHERREARRGHRHERREARHVRRHERRQ